MKKTKKTLKKIIKKMPSRWWLIAAAGVVLLLGGGITSLLLSLPSPKKLTTFPYPASTLIMDRHGKVLYEIYAEKNRIPVKLEQIPPYLRQATLAIEDKNFYHHHGFDFRGIFRAFYHIVVHHQLQGGSTITQQLVKNALLTPERTLKRKIKEAFLTIATEIIYSKDQILEMYFNQTPYGGTAWGVQAAAKTYFGKDVSELTLAEAALLAGLPAAPTRYSPFIHPDLAKKRQELVLDKMVENGFISPQDAQKAKEEKLHFVSPQTKILAPHFVFYVKEKLVEKYGQARVETGGLRVKTTLDWDLQQFAQATVATEIAKLKKYHVTNGAALVTNPKTGEILAMVGSKDYFAEDIDGKFNVTTALRQPGSAIKPINYADGLLHRRVTLATVFNDLPTCFIVGGQPKAYCPRNYDGRFRGPVQLRFALGNSLNIPAVKMLAINGLDSFIQTAQKMGIETFTNPQRYGLSLTLGGGEVRMTQMATAFGVFANMGIRRDLTAILEVKDKDGRVLEKKDFSTGKRVLPPEVAYLINHTLLDNNARSAVFGPHSWLVVKNHPEVSVKTGTTNDKRDNWTIGYNPDILVAVWVGNNDNSPMSAVASGTTGASPIWNKIISFALKDKPQKWPPKPQGIVGKTICNETGFLPPPEGCSLRFEYFIKGTEPTQAVPLRRNILIDKDTNQPVQPGEKKENTEWQSHLAVVDLLGTVSCLDCPSSEEKSPAKIFIKDNRKPFPTLAPSSPQTNPL
ncbi:PBP1A family penicillin-binding protein [bacterium]|nr:PBP1A family penicillin-binding protein [bacterium]